MGRQEEIINERLRKLNELKKAGINPYPNKYDAKNYAQNLQEKYKSIKPAKYTKDKVKIAGRLMISRDLGKIAFGTIQDSTGKIQIVLQEKETPNKVREFFKKYIDAGDFVGIEGSIFRTKRGELSVLVKNLTLLTKSILPLPEKWHGLQDDEEKLRKRYLDILINPEVKQVFIRKSKFWNTMRSFLVSKGFLEVETPILESSAGGAAATPFKTHHNSLNLDVYLRISMGELWQKKLMIAGYGKTFEIGRQFRNEGMDAEHLQDYTQMEFYWAYANYEDGMKLVQELYKTIAKETFGTTKFERNKLKFDLAKKWTVIDYASEIKKQTKIDLFNTTKEKIESKLNELNIEYEKNLDKPRLIDILWKYCRKKISGPAFLTGQLVEVSPLAKRNSKDQRKVEQFQVILAGSEVGNGYSELNDPLDQESRFKEQQKMKESGDLEAHSHDFEFVEALKYGMPPTCGFGVSERLFAFLEGKPIRETVIFPLMKPSHSKNDDSGSTSNNKDNISTNQGIGKIPPREEALGLLKEYVKSESLFNHCLCVEASMRAYAKKYNQDLDLWGIAGLLHDFDYERFPDEHPIPGVEILKKRKYSESIIRAILSHAHERTKVMPQTILDKALIAVDELSGLITALAKVRPDRYNGMNADSVEKALKKKGFAEKINRSEIETGIKQLNVDRKEHFELIIEALKKLNEKKEEK